MFTLLLIGCCLWVDARYIEPKRLIVKQETVQTNKLTSDVKLNIVLFNDVHLGEYYSLKDFNKVVEKINALSPDILLFAGDLIDDNKTFTDEEAVTSLLAKLESRYGKYAVFGNHDHGGNGTKRYKRMMKASGFQLLVDEKVTIEFNTANQISLVGVDDIILSKPNFEKALNGLDEKHFNMLMSHAPDVAHKIGDAPIALQVSGHSHGGQVRLPIIGAPFTVPYGQKYIKGFYSPNEKKDMRIYVNSGIGTSQLPYRFLNPPEITVFHLEGNG